MGSKKIDAKEKPLERMTAKELRELATKIPDVTGVHGMNKIELIRVIKKSKGIEDGGAKTTDASVREIKQKIKELKEKRVAALKASDSKMATIYRRKISRLKRKTRAAA